jgi:hypothetical protein
MESRWRFLPPDPRSEWTEKLHGFLDPADDKPEHFAAVGRLITAFNGIDVILNMILRHQLGASDHWRDANRRYAGVNKAPCKSDWNGC